MFEAKIIMETRLITVKRQTPIYEAIRTMVQNNITGLPVVDDDMILRGIITEKDVLSLLYNIEDKPGEVAGFMTKGIVSFDQENSLLASPESFCYSLESDSGKNQRITLV